MACIRGLASTSRNRYGAGMTDSILGLEGGGTKTVVWLTTGTRRCRREFGPLNLKLASDRQILTVLRQFRPTRAALCLAGCRTAADRMRVRRLAKKVWPTTKIWIGNDLDSGLAATFGTTQPGLLVISGTGSVVVGRNAAGAIARAGGWGHWLGDHGSGHWIALTGLRHAICEYDRTGRIDPALRRLLRRLKFSAPEKLVDWITGASKSEVARHADIFLRSNRSLLLQTAEFLAMDAAAVARRLQLTAPRVALAGGMLQNHPALRRRVARRIRQTLPGATVRVFRRATAEGAWRLATTNC